MKRTRACDDLVALERHCTARPAGTQQRTAKRNKIETLTDSFARVDVTDNQVSDKTTNTNVGVPRLRLPRRLLQVDVHVEANFDKMASKLQLDELADDPLPLPVVRTNTLRVSTRVLHLPQELELALALESPDTTDSPLLRRAWRVFDRVCVHAA